MTEALLIEMEQRWTAMESALEEVDLIAAVRQEKLAKLHDLQVRRKQESEAYETEKAIDEISLIRGDVAERCERSAEDFRALVVIARRNL